MPKTTIKLEQSILCFAFSAILTLGCSDDSKVISPATTDNQSVGMKLNIEQADTDGVVRAEIVVTGADMIPIKRELTITNGVLSGVLPDVPVGPSRTFTINGYDENGVLIISGSDTVDITAGETAQLNIGIKRVGEIVQVTKWISLPNVDPTDTEIEQIEFIKIPAGYFEMGSEAGNPNERPVHKVYLDEYYIGKYEITVGQFFKFITALPPLITTEYAMIDTPHYGDTINTANWIESSFVFGVESVNNENVISIMHKPPNIPVPNIKWRSAYRFCEWIGGRLPTEAEWEKAAKGTDKRIFPWGNSFTEGQAAVNIVERITTTSPSSHPNPDVIGTYLGDVSPYGVYHMGGSLSEWTNDIYDGAYYYSSPSENPQGPNRKLEYYKTLFTFRGGNFYQDYFFARTTTRQKLEYVGSNWREVIGFRCVTD